MLLPPRFPLLFQTQMMAVYSKVWFNTPQFAAAQRPQRLQKFGIKPDGRAFPKTRLVL
jgi:hypothetical protein